MTTKKLPIFFRFILPMIEVLRELGGSGKVSEVSDGIIEKMSLPEEEVEEKIKSGLSKVVNQMHWARWLLTKTGYIDTSQRGVWTLTDKGLNADLNEEMLLDIYSKRKEIQQQYTENKKQEKIVTSDETQNDDLIDESPGVDDYRSEFLNELKNLPPSGFERICQRILREAGFEQVTVTGKSNDGGIDGIGTLQVNPFVSFKVLFQCKRYQGSVGAPVVRDFRGAMMGRADKGIIMTTGSFTMEAKREARRDGVTPIELVDGEKIVNMFKEYEVGLKPTKTYVVDYKFFEEFKV